MPPVHSVPHTAAVNYIKRTYIFLQKTHSLTLRHIPPRNPLIKWPSPLPTSCGLSLSLSLLAVCGDSLKIVFLHVGREILIGFVPFTNFSFSIGLDREKPAFFFFSYFSNRCRKYTNNVNSVDHRKWGRDPSLPGCVLHQYATYIFCRFYWQCLFT